MHDDGAARRTRRQLMLVRDVMTRQPVTVTPDMSAKDALMLLDRHSITSMPVVDAKGAVLGVVGEADLVRDALPPDSRTHLLPITGERHHHAQRVEDLMTRHPVTVHEDLDLAEATEMILGTTLKSVPVVDGSRLVGMLSRRDVVHALARTDADIAGQLDELYRSIGVDWQVQVHEGEVTIDGPVGAKACSLAERSAGTVPGVMSVTIATPGMS
jgi:CBS domain-containing protein